MSALHYDKMPFLMGKIMANTNQFHQKYSQYPATAKRAQQLGNVHYFTGKPCARGHFSLRFASSGNCSKCIAEKKGRVDLNFKGKSSKRSTENQLLAVQAFDNGFTFYESLNPCPKGHHNRFVTSNNCVDCNSAQASKRKEQLKWARIKKEYSIDQQQFNAMLEKQKRECSICLTLLHEKNTHIDHCHKTKKVRSLLCNRCNQGIGLFDEDLTKIFKAATYIKDHSHAS